MSETRTEEYIETIHEIIEEKGFVKVVDIVNELCLSPSTVSEMMNRLSNDGYINYEKYRGATLTDKGLKLALTLRKKHKVIQEFLETLGIEEEIANQDACRIEHVVSDETIKVLTSYIRFIEAHSEPIWIERFKKFLYSGEFIECRCCEEEKCVEDPYDRNG
jgi:DtxR family Mn-dependent transcriptional regulator